MPLCLNPIWLKESRVTVPCGKCFNCKMNLRNQWSFRLHQEMLLSESAWFITLTYDDENVTDLNVRDIQLFVKKIRQLQLKYVSDLKLKYYCTAEYGGKTKRPHYHMILFNAVNPVIESILNCTTWTKGFTTVQPLGLGNINYINAYHIIGKHSIEGKPEPFSLMSQGIGKNWIKDNGLNTKKRKEGYVEINKCKIKMPRYYADKIWSVRDKEEMANKMRTLSEETQKKFEKIAQEKGINPFVLKMNVQEQQRLNYLKKCKKTQKI